ncbi:hypothetical protein [Nocardia sp. NPDC005366]|uniref:hypothetical protein n=1 Tax=Nocardia sp. NPDC005366 TaxID=3156878 RepID=UPI0033B3494D
MVKQDTADHHVSVLGDYTALCAALFEQTAWTPPVLMPNPVPHDTVSLEDLVAAEAVSIHEAPPTVGTGHGNTPMLSAKDVRLGRAPSRWGSADLPGSVTVRTGDVAVVISTEAAVRVCADDGVLLGPGIQLVRGNDRTVDPHFLAGVLRAAVDAAEGGPIDLYQVSIPRIPLAEQRRYGAAFRQLSELESSWQRQRSNVERLVRVGFGDLAMGVLRPAACDE